jgi:hypothetical protein
MISGCSCSFCFEIGAKSGSIFTTGVVSVFYVSYSNLIDDGDLPNLFLKGLHSPSRTSAGGKYLSGYLQES